MNGQKTLLDGIRRLSTTPTTFQSYLPHRGFTSSTYSSCLNLRLKLHYAELAHLRRSRPWSSATHVSRKLLRSSRPENIPSSRCFLTSSKNHNSQVNGKTVYNDQTSDLRKHPDVGDADCESLSGDTESSTPYRQRKRSHRPPAPDYEKMSVPELYERLETGAAAFLTGHVERLAALLVEKKLEKPSTRLYNALILANAGSEGGSAARVAKLFEEMKKADMVPDSETCHNALKALAVHPDFNVRANVLQYMREHWLAINPAGWHDIIAGYAREGLFEQALETLATIEREKLPVPDWLYDMMIYLLCEMEEMTEALNMMKNRITLGAPSHSSLNAWYQLFDTACDLLHYDALSFIWARCVKLSHINPNLGQCVCVLNAAGRAGDVELATDVFRLLTERKSMLDCTHYELLIEAYVNANDIATALTVLCIMSSSKLHPTLSSTAAIIKYLAQSPSRPLEAFEALQTLAQSRHPPASVNSPNAGPPLVVPAVAMNALLEATVQVSGLTPAIQLYKKLHTVCAHGPDVVTFNILMRGCARAERKDTAIFLASEMLAMGIKPDATTYDRLVIVFIKCAGATTDIEDAFKYYGEMKDLDFKPRQGTLQLLIRECALRADERAWALLSTMDQLGFDSTQMKKWLSENWSNNVAANSAPRSEVQAKQHS